MTEALSPYPWTHTVSLDFHPGALAHFQRRARAGEGWGRMLYTAYIRPVAINTKLGIGAVLTLAGGGTSGHRVHAHALMLGRNANGKTLLDVDPHFLEAPWTNNGTATVQEIYNLPGAIDYLMENHRSVPVQDRDLEWSGLAVLAQHSFRRNTQ